MLPKAIVGDFIKKCDALNNKKANVQIKHLLYGNQKMNGCVLRPFADGERIGFFIEEEERYMNIDELHEVGFDGRTYYMKSDVMELYIML